MKTTVVNMKTDEYDVYIGRPSRWGNPYKILTKGNKRRTREEAIESYRKYIRNRPELLKKLKELKGKRLGCYCKPLPCHGDVLVELIEELYPDEPAETTDKVRGNPRDVF